MAIEARPPSTATLVASRPSPYQGDSLAYGDQDKDTLDGHKARPRLLWTVKVQRSASSNWPRRHRYSLPALLKLITTVTL
ncbi:Thioredoxin-like_fold domain-containing protein [Psidium guajava]|nr:Thioredoxin-like_fold domain-containing protein [Psidium guajava]